MCEWVASKDFVRNIICHLVNNLAWMVIYWSIGVVLLVTIVDATVCASFISSGYAMSWKWWRKINHGRFSMENIRCKACKQWALASVLTVVEKILSLLQRAIIIGWMCAQRRFTKGHIGSLHKNVILNPSRDGDKSGGPVNTPKPSMITGMKKKSAIAFNESETG